MLGWTLDTHMVSAEREPTTGRVCLGGASNGADLGAKPVVR